LSHCHVDPDPDTSGGETSQCSTAKEILHPDFIGIRNDKRIYFLFKQLPENIVHYGVTRYMKFTAYIIFILFFLQLNLYPQNKDTTEPGLGADRAVLLATDSLFSKLSAEKGMGSACLVYMAEDASIFPAGENIITGRENIKKHFADVSPNTALTWKPLEAKIANSGELGYTYGISEFKFPDNNGHPVYRQGKYVTIWKKQTDGSWKFILDIDNANPLPPQE
jgi:ketosteroid isomerase-like protein